ncbi:hypothetical protein Sango_2250200 [Sesamum angolense]|uniref:F-box associated beta-propeller type 3 domain-containing protein n=1 Tax=Sesamum angolense TaxID=2727404 RepID=A0AAE2BKW2_9LAMI|nr:hypothetical protein Sango_2250200 [Sesamum angolense]
MAEVGKIEKREKQEMGLGRTFDGLLCLNLKKPGDEVAHICNPFTGDCLVLPGDKPKCGHISSLVYGLGFCRLANKYKVLRVTCYPDPPQPAGCGYGEILTIGVDSRWRSLENPAISMVAFLDYLISLNGVLHWLFSSAGDHSSCMYNFDLGEERLGQTPSPLEWRCLLSKDGGSLLNHNLVSGMILKAWYYPTCSFLDAVLGSRPSSTWRSILGARNLGEQARVGWRYSCNGRFSVRSAYQLAIGVHDQNQQSTSYHVDPQDSLQSGSGLICGDFMYFPKVKVFMWKLCN